jgi:pimeloyl-ACP methyl ester carboxylesterase
MKHTTLLGLLVVLLVAPVAAKEPYIEDVTFTSRSVTLSGAIAWPGDGPPIAAVVFVHGSGEQSRNLALAQCFADRGVAALVYDKRGVGESAGVYEGNQSVSGMNIALLADDAAAALDALAGHAALDGAPVGFAGISQAGWIAPLAAAKSNHAKFLLLWSAPVCKVSEEDIYSKHTMDEDGPQRPSFSSALAARTDTYLWPDFLGRDTDSAQDLSQLRIRGFWIFGEHDGSIPVDLSLRNLATLQAQGHRFDFRVFLGQGHNNLAATFDAAIHWINDFARRSETESVPTDSIRRDASS